jgi:hypothetical protein
MKKPAALILTMGLVAALATGCASTEKETATATEGASTAVSTEIKMGKVDYAPHGTKSFAVAVVAMDGDKIVGATMDEYQFMDKATSVGVPNSDADFGKNYGDPTKVLASKATNADQYSKNMKEKGGATKSIQENKAAIDSFVIGKTVAELEAELAKYEKTPEKMTDAVSGATLADTYGYVKTYVEAAKAAK